MIIDTRTNNDESMLVLISESATPNALATFFAEAKSPIRSMTIVLGKTPLLFPISTTSKFLNCKNVRALLANPFISVEFKILTWIISKLFNFSMFSSKLESTGGEIKTLFVKDMINNVTKRSKKAFIRLNEMRMIFSLFLLRLLRKFSIENCICPPKQNYEYLKKSTKNVPLITKGVLC